MSSGKFRAGPAVQPARGHLYRLLFRNGNPEINTLHEILRSFGLDLAIVPRKSHKLPKAA